MHHDAHGLALSTGSAAAAALFDDLVDGYLGYRADLAPRLAAVLAKDPAFGLAHCVGGYLALLSFARAYTEAAAAAAVEARRHTSLATPREQTHVAALEAWVGGRPENAVAIWEHILVDYPRDILAFRLAHFVNFWHGRPDRMLASVLTTEPHWDPDLPAWDTILACRCFALEECGRYTEAEAAGRAAIDRNPANPWAAHGVAHVLEMQGRRAEGIAWINALRANWEGAGNMRHHLYWHEALFHLERGDTARVLALYDADFRDLDAKLTRMAPDVYIDVQNAASMLFRLERRGVDVGGRWTELADKAEARIGDCLSAFTLPHWMMALCATHRFAAAERMLAEIREQALGPGEAGTILSRSALPVCAAVLAHARGAHADAVALMRPALGDISRLGGSHAQRDVLDQLYLDAAEKAGLEEDVRLVLERVAGIWPTPPARRAGYAAAASRVGFA
ncbi:MAG: tetratricopeptide repeat protein [Acetobacteraceae bacterium]